MTRDRRHYDNDTKASAVGLAVLKGQREASRETGIPIVTLHQWFHSPEYEQLRTETRDRVADKMWAVIQVGLDAVAEGLRNPKAPLRDKATAFGIVFDKHALLTGAATARTESRDLTGTIADADLIAALRTADEITDQGGDQAAAEEPAAG